MQSPNPAAYQGALCLDRGDDGTGLEVKEGAEYAISCMQAVEARKIASRLWKSSAAHTAGVHTIPSGKRQEHLPPTPPREWRVFTIEYSRYP